MQEFNMSLEDTTTVDINNDIDTSFLSANIQINSEHVNLIIAGLQDNVTFVTDSFSLYYLLRCYTKKVEYLGHDFDPMCAVEYMNRSRTQNFIYLVHNVLLCNLLNQQNQTKIVPLNNYVDDIHDCAQFCVSLLREFSHLSNTSSESGVICSKAIDLFVKNLLASCNLGKKDNLVLIYSAEMSKFFNLLGFTIHVFHNNIYKILKPGAYSLLGKSSQASILHVKTDSQCCISSPTLASLPAPNHKVFAGIRTIVLLSDLHSPYKRFIPILRSFFSQADKNIIVHHVSPDDSK